RSVLGKVELDALLSEREKLNEHLQQIIDDQTEPWGVKVTTVEIKDVEIPDRMQHAIARQAEAERERRAKVINAEGEFQAASRLSDAAELIGRNPVTIQLRALQTLMEVSGNQGSTIVFPVPMNLLQSGSNATPVATSQEAIEAAKAVLEAGVAARPAGRRRRARRRGVRRRAAALARGARPAPACDRRGIRRAAAAESGHARVRPPDPAFRLPRPPGLDPRRPRRGRPGRRG